MPSKVQRLSEVIQRFPSAQQKDNVARIVGAMERRLAALCDPDGEEQRPQSLGPMGPWLRSGGDVTQVPLPPLPLPFKGAACGLLVALLDLEVHGFGHATKDQLIAHAKKHSQMEQWVSAVSPVPSRDGSISRASREGLLKFKKMILGTFWSRFTTRFFPKCQKG